MKLLRSVTMLLFGCLAMILLIATHAEAQSSRNAEPNKSEFQKTKPGQMPEFNSQAEKDAWIRNQQAMKKSEYNRAQNITAPMPDFTNEAEKDEWMKLNPPKTVVTRSEFESLPPRKQASMKADSNYIILD